MFDIRSNSEELLSSFVVIYVCYNFTILKTWSLF